LKEKGGDGRKVWKKSRKGRKGIKGKYIKEIVPH
jgi:hypothetical protein